MNIAIVVIHGASTDELLHLSFSATNSDDSLRQCVLLRINHTVALCVGDIDVVHFLAELVFVHWRWRVWMGSEATEPVFAFS